MAKRKIVWTRKANLERKEILSYWIERNKSNIYSIKLNKLIVQTLGQLSVNPTIGRMTDENLLPIISESNNQTEWCVTEALNMNNTTSKLLFALCAVLALCTLPMTFVWLEIGPLGKAYYGPTVPDVYIKGAYITGKDLGFVYILYAALFQLGVIIYYSVISLLLINTIKQRSTILFLALHQFGLLILFPAWLWLYVDGVVSNSDGAAADLEIHCGSGLLIYCMLFVLNLINLIRLAYFVYLKKE